MLFSRAFLRVATGRIRAVRPSNDDTEPMPQGATPIGRIQGEGLGPCLFSQAFPLGRTLGRR
jgi:hypothetical protein